MGKILTTYKNFVISQIVDAVESNTTQIYAFASNPVENSNGVPTELNDDNSNMFEFVWPMIFGKKLANTDICPVIDKNLWGSNTIYDFYDNYSNTLHTNNNFYVVSAPAIVGGYYHIYKCIDNNNGEPSTVDPDSIGTPTQATTFETSDGYKWRYLTSISSANYTKFGSTDYIPIYANATIVSQAKTNAGIEKVVVTNGGTGYDAYHNGIIQTVVNTTLLQVSNSASSDNFRYNNNSIYIYNTLLGTAQLSHIDSYVTNSSGKFIYLESEANTDIIFSGTSEYIISPRVVFETDGVNPQAYSVINTTSNSIHSIIIVDIGSNINRANVYLTTIYGSGANLYCVVPPPGGHGADPASELNAKGLTISFSFSNTESNTIITSNIVYNKIGLIYNPHSLNANNTKGSRYYSNTFEQILKATVTPSYTFTPGETVIGVDSGSKGIVLYSNSTTVYLVGDMGFTEDEFIGNTSIANIAQISISSLGDIYHKDLVPLYIKNINNINRLDTQTESFKLTIQV